MKNVTYLPIAEMYRDKNISLPIALSLSLHPALSVCLKLLSVVFYHFFFDFGGILSDEVEKFAPSDALFIY